MVIKYLTRLCLMISTLSLLSCIGECKDTEQHSNIVFTLDGIVRGYENDENHSAFALIGPHYISGIKTDPNNSHEIFFDIRYGLGRPIDYVGEVIPLKDVNQNQTVYITGRIRDFVTDGSTVEEELMEFTELHFITNSIEDNRMFATFSGTVKKEKNGVIEYFPITKGEINNVLINGDM